MQSRETFEQFTGAELPRLLGLARALTTSDHDAWDLVQEALVKVGVRWNSVRSGSNPAAYTRTIMIRLNIDRLRRTRREWLTEMVPEVPAFPTESGIEPWLHNAIRVLTPRQRTAVALRYGADMDMATIAKEMNCSVGTVKSHLSRALGELRRCAPAPGSMEGKLHE